MSDNKLEETAKEPEGKKVVKYHHAHHWDDIFNAEFSKESDRASVILSASLLDIALHDLLINYLLPSTTTADDLFDGANAPLSTFSSKIILVHRLGLISAKFCRGLHLIRKIRNEFAHNIHGCTFEESRVRSRVLELFKSVHASVVEEIRSTFPQGPRGDFMFCASWMLWSLNAEVQDCKAVSEAQLEFGFVKYS